MNAPHDAHVLAGGCPSISRYRSWCNGPAGHAGSHHAPYLHPGGQTTPLFWTDNDDMPRVLA